MGLPLFFLLLVSFASYSKSELAVDYYDKACPDFESIVLEVAHYRQAATPEMAASTLRVFFHDCMVSGCDASVLLKSNGTHVTERDHDINLSLGAPTFDLVNEIKTKVEKVCPGVVSCSDILSASTRVLIQKIGGPSYRIPFGRKDALISAATNVEGHLATTNTSVSRMIEMFAAKGFSIQDYVALVGGGHTIGFVHCHEIAFRIGNPPDPTMNPVLVESLREGCKDYEKEPDKCAFLDVRSPGIFDNVIFQSYQNGLGVLKSDQVMYADPRTKVFIDKYAEDNDLFFDDFAQAMEKVVNYGIKEGKAGEVRKHCEYPNHMHHGGGHHKRKHPKVINMKSHSTGSHH